MLNSFTIIAFIVRLPVSGLKQIKKNLPWVTVCCERLTQKPLDQKIEVSVKQLYTAPLFPRCFRVAYFVFSIIHVLAISTVSTHEAKEDDAFLIVAQRSSIPTQVYSIQLAYRQSHLKLGKLLWENSAYRSNLEKVWECLWGAGIRERWKESRACGRFGLPEPEPGPAREVRLWESSHAQLLFIIVFIFVNFEERKTRINKRCVRSSNIDKSKKFEHFRCDNFEPRASNKKVPSFQKNKVVIDWRNYDREDKYFIVFSQFVDIVVVNVVVVVDVVVVIVVDVVATVFVVVVQRSEEVKPD